MGRRTFKTVYQSQTQTCLLLRSTESILQNYYNYTIFIKVNQSNNSYFVYTITEPIIQAHIKFGLRRVVVPDL